MNPVAILDNGRTRVRAGLVAVLLLWAGAVEAADLKVLPMAGGASLPPLQCPSAATLRKASAATAPQDAPTPPGPEALADIATGADAQQPDLSFQEPPAVFRQRDFLRIALWGDSHAAAMFFSDALAERLGYSLDRVQPSFLPPSMGMPGVRLPLRKACLGPGWTRSMAYRSGPHAGRFGKALLRASTEQSGSYLWLDVRSTRHPDGLQGLDIQWSAADGAGSPRTVVAVSVNDQPEEIVAVDRESDRWLKIKGDAPVLTVKLRLVAGQLALDGFVPHYAEAPALIMDTFGIPGATAKGWENIDPGLLRDEANAQPYDVVMLEYGTNEGNDPGFSAAKYAASLRATLTNLRAVYPESACILIGPTDRGVLLKKTRGRTQRRKGVDMLAYARTHRAITEVQQRVGREMGCLSWDWQGAMGGPGGAYRWLYRNPPWMSRDLIHLTPLGYQQSARMLADKLRGRTAVGTGS